MYSYRVVIAQLFSSFTRNMYYFTLEFFTPVLIGGLSLECNSKVRRVSRTLRSILADLDYAVISILPIIIIIIIIIIIVLIGSCLKLDCRIGTLFRISAVISRIEIPWLLAQRLECSPMARETWVQSQVESYQRL